MVVSYLRRAYSSFATHVLDVPARLLAFLFSILLLVIPLTNPGLYIMFVLVLANLFAIFAASWDILAGRTGQLSLGHALFFGIGGYTSAILYKYYALPLWITIPIGMLIAFLVAFLVGFPCLRVKGPYLSLVTLAFPLILISIFFMFKDVTGGEMGLYAPSILPIPPYTPYELRLAEFYVSMLMLVVSSIIIYKIASSKMGIIFVSILDDELAAKASGINTTKYKLLAFAISALFASLAGGFYVHFLRTAGPSALMLTMSFFPVIMTILGGIGTIYGPLVGAYILTILDQYVLKTVVPIPEELHAAIYTAIVLILVIAWPRGVARWCVDKLEDMQEVREEEIEKKIRKKK